MSFVTGSRGIGESALPATAPRRPVSSTPAAPLTAPPGAPGSNVHQRLARATHFSHRAGWPFHWLAHRARERFFVLVCTSLASCPPALRIQAHHPAQTERLRYLWCASQVGLSVHRRIRQRAPRLLACSNIQRRCRPPAWAAHCAHAHAARSRAHRRATQPKRINPPACAGGDKVRGRISTDQSIPHRGRGGVLFETCRSCCPAAPPHEAGAWTCSFHTAATSRFDSSSVSGGEVLD